ncbi:MAG: thiamine pyrophosphate-dependent enzyme [Chloroflexota bacterium]|nr:thiamine pyrophosphate-dependent enzyme [Chloroflexota bacterium]
MKQLLSGNEAIALGAYHAGVRVACSYPGTPSTEILESMARFDDVYVEWSTNEKTAMEVGLGAAIAGVRTLVSMKHVGLNVAADAFFAAANVGVRGGLVVACADDPGMHSSQNEQDNRHYARFAKVPMLEPSDSQEAYSLMERAFRLSEELDSPILLRTTTRISHAKSVLDVDGERPEPQAVPPFIHSPSKYVMVPTYARPRHPLAEERIQRAARLFEDFPFNQITWGDRRLGVVSAGVAYQYAREVFPEASFLKLVTTYPVPEGLVRGFVARVETLLVVEELDPFLEDIIKAMGIPVQGKSFVPIAGELNTDAVREGALREGLIAGPASQAQSATPVPEGLPPRPPLLCPGCPHRGVAYVLSRLKFGPKGSVDEGGSRGKQWNIATSDIGCYTLMVYPPLCAIDSCVCMGASITMAHGLEKAGVAERTVSVLGDSTFIHTGIPGLVNMVYNRSHSTVIVLDNQTTAMTGHQGHPGAGRSARNEESPRVDIVELARGIGIKDVNVVSAFDLREIERTIERCTSNDEPSLIVVRGPCTLHERVTGTALRVNPERCGVGPSSSIPASAWYRFKGWFTEEGCRVCLDLGCPAITFDGGKAQIIPNMCIGESCSLCAQVCAREAIEKPSN